jgi:hypothetical protein
MTTPNQSRIVPAVHGRRAVPPDPQFEVDLAKRLREAYAPAALVEQYGRFANGDGELDALTRERAQELILKVWRDTGKMVFFITHSVEEALFMGTKLIVMSPRPGRISHVFDLPFSKQYFESGNAREIKASAEFISLRETILRIIFADEAGANHE